jgi:hypothetical protein
MENDKNENIDSQIDEMVEDTITEDETEENNEDESESDNLEKLSALEKKVKELEAQKKHWKEKAVKKPEVSSDTKLSPNDLYALMKKGVHEDDIDTVVKQAKLNGVSVKEALQLGEVKAILDYKEETRKTAEVSNTGNTRKGATAKDADTLVAKTKKGEFPQSVEEMQKVFLRMKGLDK